MSAYDRILTHTCDIQDNSPTQDSIGALVDNWSTTSANTAVACKFIDNTMRRPSPIQSDQFLTSYTLLLPAGTTVTTAQRIANITFEDGSTEAGPFVIERVSSRRTTRKEHHVSLGLEKVNRG